MRIEKLQKLFTEKGWTLCTAESCTGGAVAAKITQRSGASSYFQGGVICYSNEWKENFLGVDSSTLKKNGAVSEEVVLEMAQKLQQLSQATFTLAISGVAGPEGGTIAKPVGTVWFAFAKEGEAKALLLHLLGTRREIIEKAVDFALAEMYEFASKTRK